MAEPMSKNGGAVVSLQQQYRAANGKLARMYYSAPRAYISGVDMDSPEAEEYDRRLSERYPNAPKKYAVYKNVIDSGDVFNVMRVIDDSKAEEEARKAALADAIAKGDRIAEIAHRDALNAIKGTTRVNSITYGAGRVFGSSTDTRPTEDLKFFDSRQKAQRWLARRAATYKKPKGKTGGQIFHQWNELDKRIEGARRSGSLSEAEATRRKERIWNAYLRYSKNIRSANRGKTDADTKYVSRERYTR